MAMLVYTDPSGREFSVPIGPDHPVVSIGRATDCTIRSNRKSVSRRHAEFHYSNGRYEVIDLNSSNGTYLIINEERKPVVQPEPLNHSDEVWCGDFILRFYEEEEQQQSAGGNAYQEQAQGFAQGPPPQAQEDSYALGRSTHNFGQNGDFGAPGIQGGIQGGVQGGVQSGFSNRPQSGSFGQPIPAAQPGPPVGHGNQNAPIGVGLGQGLSEPSYPQEAPGGSAPRFDEELNRLKSEKASIEQLASRQADEMEMLRAALERSKEETQELRTQLQEQEDREGLSLELEAAKREQERLVDELRMTHEGASNPALEAALDEARATSRQLEGKVVEATAKIDDLRQHLIEVEENARNREAELTEELATLEKELEIAQSTARESPSRGDTREEVNSLRKELQRQERLLEEFEKRSREFQSEADEQTSKVKELEKSLFSSERDLTSAQADLKTAEGRLKEAKVELKALAETRKKLAALEEERDNLKSEIEGLKQRLRLEKQRSKQAGIEDVDALQEELDSLREEVKLLKSSQGLSADALGEVATKLHGLDRLFDAIERADLEELSTVDRVRLRSALREARPKETLLEILAMLGTT